MRLRSVTESKRLTLYNQTMSDRGDDIAEINDLARVLARVLQVHREDTKGKVGGQFPLLWRPTE